MTPRQPAQFTRQNLLTGNNMLVVYRDPLPPPVPAPGQPGTPSDFIPSEPELFIAMLADGRVLGFNGHVDLGTGIRTALAQIVAEELDVPFSQVEMVLGNPFEVPNQGPTIASASIQISAVPLRTAAAQARWFLLERAAAVLGCGVESLCVDDGVVHLRAQPEKRVSFGELLEGERFSLKLAESVPLKPVQSHRVVGKSMPRVDIPAKASGALTFVHDVRVPGMLHGRVVRPPYVGRDSGDFVGSSLLSVDKASIAQIPGIVDVVVIGDFIGVVAEREEHAERAARQLKVQWKPVPPLESMDDLPSRLRGNPAKRRLLKEAGDPELLITRAGRHELQREYVWPYQMHASIGPSCAVADVQDDFVRVWSGTQNPHSLRVDLSRLLELDEGCIEVLRMEASGCYGRNCADDVCGDAVLLARAVGRPVRVQLTREQEHGWEPKGAAQLMDVRGGLGPDGGLAHYDFVSRYPSNDGPLLASLLTGMREPVARVLQMGDRTAVPPYLYPTMRISCDDTAPIVRASWLRGVSALPNSFAHESFMDELAAEAGVDPVAFRLRHLAEARPIALIEAVAERADWGTPAPQDVQEGWSFGRGFAYAHYVHSKFPGFGAAMAAWVVELEVEPETGRILLRRVVVGQDAGLMINPAGVRHQVHGNVVQSLSRVLKERVEFDGKGVVSLEWGGYPILTFPELPMIDVMLMERPSEPPLGVGESASLPAAPAIAAALFNATGVRFRQPPFTPDVVATRLRESKAAGAQGASAAFA